jgi:peptide/nickel transport system ATP-binding protein/oligopeptide transport system ATP-binding protein
MLFMSHDLSVVRVMSDRVAVMFAGQIMELAENRSLFDNPLHPYTQELLAAVPLPDPAKARREAAAPRDTKAESTKASEQGCPFATRCPHVMDVCRDVMPPLVDYGPRLGEIEPHLAACHWAEQTTNGVMANVQ